MSLIHCPECGHEISAAAVACPNCGRPIHATPVIERKAVITKTPREGGIPPWAIVSLIALGGILLLVLFVTMGREDDANANLRVNVNTKPPAVARQEIPRSETTVGTASDPSTITVPSTSEPQSVTVPGTAVTAVPAAPAMPTKGSVTIDAKIATRNGSPQPVRNEKFYLLDKDLEMILSDADIEPIEGQTLLNSFGLSVMYPDRYGDFHRQALRAIKNHIKYAGTTDGSGKAELGGIEPSSYYLFGVTKSPRGFAVWSSPVSVNPGENILNLTPQQLTEVENTSGE
jgi:hypothetical protein